MNVIREKIHSVLQPAGFDVHPFKIGWYNEKVQAAFNLPYHEDTLAFCIISTPSMFEQSFLPFVEKLKKRDAIENRDPIDSCVTEQLERAKQVLCTEYGVDVIYDFEVHPLTRRPKLLVQTVGHVSGAAYYYQRDDVSNDPWGPKKKIYGVSIHPKFGGWFAFRGAIIIKDVMCHDLPPSVPPKTLTSDDDVIDLLERFNFQWRDNTFRDVIAVEESYSDQQIRYFDTAPSKRFVLLGLEDKIESSSALWQ